VRIKSKTDRSMRQSASDPVTLALSFSLYWALGPCSSFRLFLRPINSPLEGWSSLTLLQFHFTLLRIESEP
jgi:hypothetical protein